MANLKEEFISKEPKQYTVKIGRDLASALSGFIAGVVFASIVWAITIYLVRLFD